jgi:hypothetical protein
MADLEKLLLEGESVSLDFKREQYPFADATPEAKAKLLKDILAMSNSWRKVPAYILIGVDANADDSPNVIGITSHIDDAALQQFVNEKTNRTIRFSYQRAALCGKTIGVIEIPVQRRPFYLRNDFAKLRRNIVYFRRGSSNTEATPDEILKMGEPIALGGGDLKVEFADTEKRRRLGNSLSIECGAITVENEDNLPDYDPRPSSGFYIPSIDRPNTDYYRELVAYVKAKMLLKKIALTLTNEGSLSAQSIRVEFVIPDLDREWEFCDTYEYVDRPPDKSSLGTFAHAVKPILANREPGCEVEYSDGNWHLNFDLKDLQPQRTLSPGVEFYAGCRRSSTLTLTGRVFAAGLPDAGTCELTLVAQTKAVSTDLKSVLKAFKS